jgi:hypothetical protein
MTQHKIMRQNFVQNRQYYDQPVVDFDDYGDEVQQRNFDPRYFNYSQTP